MQDVSAYSQTQDSAVNPATIALCIPTYRRTDLLRQCLTAVAGLRVPGGSRLLVLVADNDAGSSARAVCEDAARTSGLRLRYFMEPQRGLCSVRNRLLEETLQTDAQWLAFLDDDEQPAPDWLAVHLHALSTSGADVSSGPVIQGPLNATLTAAPAPAPGGAGHEPRFVACNNVMFRRDLIAGQGLRFDSLFNFTGGEDFDFFEASRRRGNRHVWTGAALVHETVAPDRSTLRYIFHRHWSGAMTRVMQQRKWHGGHLLWPHFLIKAAGKLLGGTASLLLALLPPHRPALRECIKRYANACGYLCGLLDLRSERYR